MAQSADTERNGRAQELARAEQRYRDLIEWLPVIVYEAELGPQGQWYYVSPHIERMLGYAAADLQGDPGLFNARLHPDDREEIMELERTEAEMARHGDVTLVSEYRLLHRDGNVVWVRDEARMVSPEGIAPYWRGVLIDITEAREAERALAESHERYRGLVTAFLSAPTRLIPRSRIAASSSPRRSASSSATHRRSGTPTPRSWESTLHPTDRSRVLGDEERHVTMAVGTPWVSEYRLLSHSGAVIWVRDRAVVAEGPGGHRVIDGILTDVTADRGDGPGRGTIRDVLRLTCASCGAVHAGEHAGPCVECGSGDVEAVSLNATLSELTAARAQVEILLDGVHQHLETVSGTAERATQITRSMPAVERRIMARPTGPAGGGARPPHRDPSSGQ